MFSLYKNYVKEQQELIHTLQEKLIKQNVKTNELSAQLTTHHNLVPYFKQIAQIFSFYCLDNTKSTQCPDGVTGANIMLQIIDSFLEGEVDDSLIKEVESNISQWENKVLTHCAEYNKNELELPAKSQNISKKKIEKQSPQSVVSELKPIEVNGKKIVGNFGGLVLFDDE